MNILERVEGRQLQVGQCTAHLSLASPTKKSSFVDGRLWSGGYQNGLIMNHDFLLMFSNNDFERGNSALARQAQLAIDAESAALSRLWLRFQWGSRVHGVMENYFLDPDIPVDMTGWLRGLYRTCVSPP